MINLFKEINKKLNSIIWVLVITGVILLMLAILVAWTEFMVRLVFSLIILIIAYAFLHGAYKTWALKKEIEKHFKF